MQRLMIFLGYLLVSKAFRVFNTRRQQTEETYHVTFDENTEAISYSNHSEEEIGIDDSSRYPSDEYHPEHNTSTQYQADADFSYYISPHDLPFPTISEFVEPQNNPEVSTPLIQLIRALIILVIMLISLIISSSHPLNLHHLLIKPPQVLTPILDLKIAGLNPRTLNL